MIAVSSPRGVSSTIAGSCSSSNSTAESAADAVLQFLRLDRRQEPDRAEVDREDWYPGARVAAQRAQDRAVPAQHHAQLRIAAERSIDLDAWPRGKAVLAGLLGVEPQRRPGGSGLRDHDSAEPPRFRRGAGA